MPKRTYKDFEERVRQSLNGKRKPAMSGLKEKLLNLARVKK